MKGSNSRRQSLRKWLGGLGVLTVLSFTGCQSEYGNQTLPSPYYLENTIHYYPTGSEFKLSKEAAAQKAYNQELIQQQSQQPRR